MIGSLYGPPNSPPLEFINKLNSISKIKNKDKEAILGMDHNLDLLKANKHKHTQLFIDDLLDKDVLPTISRPTCITHNPVTLIDNIFVTEKLHHFFESAILLPDISDHLPSLTLLKQTKLTHKSPLEFEGQSLGDRKLKSINMKLLQTDWSKLLNVGNSDKQFDTFLKHIHDTMDEISPIRKVKISPK